MPRSLVCVAGLTVLAPVILGVAAYQHGSVALWENSPHPIIAFVIVITWGLIIPIGMIWACVLAYKARISS